ncbi:MAG: hypothetical protein ACRDPT_03670 [Streptomycetales bacterium]
MHQVGVPLGEAAHMLGRTRSEVIQLVGDGVLKPWGATLASYRFPTDQLEALLNGKTQPPVAPAASLFAGETDHTGTCDPAGSPAVALSTLRQALKLIPPTLACEPAHHGTDPFLRVGPHDPAATTAPARTTNAPTSQGQPPRPVMRVWVVPTRSGPRYFWPP